MCESAHRITEAIPLAISPHLPEKKKQKQHEKTHTQKTPNQKEICEVLLFLSIVIYLDYLKFRPNVYEVIKSLDASTHSISNKNNSYSYYVLIYKMKYFTFVCVCVVFSVAVFRWSRVWKKGATFEMWLLFGLWQVIIHFHCSTRIWQKFQAPIQCELQA